jgi:UDP-glucuronate 4-epimerase
MSERIILVTGGAGFIGSHLVDSLVNKGFAVVVVDNFNNFYNPKIKWQNLSNALKTGKVKVEQGDIRSIAFMGSVFKRYSVKVVYHLAAMAGIGPSFLYPKLYADVNIMGTLNLLAIASNQKLTHFIFTSSSSVYGKRENGPFRETDNLNQPLSPYAMTKAAAEQICHLYASKNKMPITIARIFNAYGPRNRPDMACYRFMDALHRERPIVVYGDGEVRRDYTYVGDVVSGLVEMGLRKKRERIINIGSSFPISINLLIRKMEITERKKAKIKYTPKKEGDAPLTFADYQRASRLYDWRPKTGLDKGIKLMYEWYQKRTE